MAGRIKINYIKFIIFIISLAVIIIFGRDVFVKRFFNEQRTEIPNVTNLDVKDAEKNHESIGIQAEQVLDNLKVNLKNIYYKIQSLEKSLEALKTAVEVSEETYELETERYNNRLITLNDLLKAESNLRQARTNYLSSRLNYYYLVSQYGSLLD